jgi:hypothetical protein
MEHVERIALVRLVDFDRPPYDGLFIEKSRVGKPCASAGHIVHRPAQQHGSYGARRSGIANAHFARSDDIVPILPMRAQVLAGLYRLPGFPWSWRAMLISRVVRNAPV